MATHLLPVEQTKVDTSRYECLNGQLIERPVPARPHGRLQRRIANLIESAIEKSNMEVEAEISIDRWDEEKSDWLTPDVLVSTGSGFKEAKNGHVLPPALLAIEVLSSGQNFSNMRRKVTTLIEWGVTEVWLVDGQSQSISVFPSSDTSKSETVYEGNIATGDHSVSLFMTDIFG